MANSRKKKTRKRKSKKKTQPKRKCLAKDISDKDKFDVFGNPMPIKHLISESVEPVLFSREEKLNIFVAEYLKDFNGARAARVAGYARSSAAQEASRLLTDANLKKRIEDGVREITAASKNGAKKVYSLLYDMATTDIIELFERNPDGRFVVRDLDNIPKGVRLNIASMREVYDSASGEWCFHIRLTSKEKALEMLGRYYKMFVERHEHSGSIGFSDIASKVPDPLFGKKEE